MYGMIHNAVRDMVIDGHGQDVWNAILQDSGVGEDAFLSMQSYEDTVVLSLVASTSKTLNAPVSDCLEQFGMYWILETARKQYGPLLKGFGPTVWDLLANLDHMHDRISSSFPGYDAPSFSLHKLDGQEYELHYRSSRQGLTPFVIGLLKGLSVMFDTPLSITLAANTSTDQGQHSVFILA